MANAIPDVIPADDATRDAVIKQVAAEMAADVPALSTKELGDLYTIARKVELDKALASVAKVVGTKVSFSRFVFNQLGVGYAIGSVDPSGSWIITAVVPGGKVTIRPTTEGGTDQSSLALDVAADAIAGLVDIAKDEAGEVVTP